MTGSVFSPTFEALPASIPVFPLMGVLLLPGGRLPLNIFEPRYVSMIDDALGDARMIGMIQPTEHENTTSAPNLNRTGCAGRLTSFSETPDGRYLITLSGLCRFDIESEVPTTRGYRRAVGCDDLAGFEAAVSDSLNMLGPHLIHVRILPGSMNDLGRPTVTPDVVARRFKDFLARR